jgi:hypothetical protein
MRVGGGKRGGCGGHAQSEMQVIHMCTDASKTQIDTQSQEVYD